MAYLYIFGETCDPAQIDTDCSSGGATGTISAELDPGVEQKVSFTPSRTGMFYFAVDSACAPEYGLYEITISES